MCSSVSFSDGGMLLGMTLGEWRCMARPILYRSILSINGARELCWRAVDSQGMQPQPATAAAAEQDSVCPVASWVGWVVYSLLTEHCIMCRCGGTNVLQSIDLHRCAAASHMLLEVPVEMKQWAWPLDDHIL
jgi:hypothetical protein